MILYLLQIIAYKEFYILITNTYLLYSAKKINLIEDKGQHIIHQTCSSVFKIHESLITGYIRMKTGKWHS